MVPHVHDKHKQVIIMQNGKKEHAC
uniref:Uncharacterized protein n=1 Tax=Arundo donax TaxID=35708 RepID=A0A0A8ZDC1_ARUDO